MQRLHKGEWNANGAPCRREFNVKQTRNHHMMSDDWWWWWFSTLQVHIWGCSAKLQLRSARVKRFSRFVFLFGVSCSLLFSFFWNLCAAPDGIQFIRNEVRGRNGAINKAPEFTERSNAALFHFFGSFGVWLTRSHFPIYLSSGIHSVVSFCSSFCSFAGLSLVEKLEALRRDLMIIFSWRWIYF